jgi:hypothetical protein
MTKGTGPSPTANDLPKRSLARRESMLLCKLKMTHITNAIMDMLEIFDAPESKLMPNAMRETIEPKAEIWRRGFLPSRCEEINLAPQVRFRLKYLD